MTPFRIVITALVATVSISLAVVRHDMKKRERRALPALAAPRYLPPVTPVSAPVAGRARFDAEVERACRTMMGCLLDDWKVDEGVGDCVAEVNAKLAPELASFAEVGGTPDDIAGELAAMNARCANRCDRVVSCYGSMPTSATY